MKVTSFFCKNTHADSLPRAAPQVPKVGAPARRRPQAQTAQTQTAQAQPQPSRKKLVRDAQSASSEQLLTTLLTQMMLKGTLAKKHGENVVTGYADNVKPDALAPVRSRVQYRKDAADADMRDAMRSMLAAGGAAAAVAGPQAPPAFPGREPTPPPGAWD